MSLHLNFQVYSLCHGHRTFLTIEFLVSVFMSPFHPNVRLLCLPAWMAFSELSCSIHLLQRTSCWHSSCSSCLLSASLIASFIFAAARPIPPPSVQEKGAGLQRTCAMLEPGFCDRVESVDRKTEGHQRGSVLRVACYCWHFSVEFFKSQEAPFEQDIT